MVKSKKQMYIVIGVFALVMLLGTVTYAFFNYTRTGSSNTFKVGRISFNSSQAGVINLTDAFPITSTQAETDTTNAKSVSIIITGDTDYTGGVEYLVTTSDVNLEVNGKQLPIALEISVAGNNSKTLGTVETGDYYTNRNSYSVSKYKVEYNGELEDGTHLLVGYIAPNTTSGTAEGVDGIITIKAYIDKDKILISDTYDGTESDDMGTPNSMAEGKTVFTTTEWNSIQGSPLSFKVKVEANEGIWVKEPVTLHQTISRQVSTKSYIASYDDFVASNQNYSTFTTQDQVLTNAPKQTVYYYTGDDAAANANVLFAGYCWQIIRTTDNGGVRMIYNGVAQKGITLNTEIISDSDITYTNDGTYPYTYDSTTKKWISGNAGVKSSTGTFLFTINTAGNYAINYTVSSEAGYDKAKFYKNNTLIKEDSGTMTSQIDLGTLATPDEIKVEYTKDSGRNTGNDNVIFEIARVTNRVESENLECQPNRTATKGINGQEGAIQSMSAATLFGRSYDYDLDTGQFTIEDSSGLPTSWTTNDNNSNGTEDYKELIGTYTCLSSSATCTTLYYVGSIHPNNTTQAYVSEYTIGDVDHYSQMGTSAFNPNAASPAMVGYMFNTEYDYKQQSKSGEYYTSAAWENGAYVLSNGNGGTAPDTTHHYICDSDCTKVRYYYYVNGSNHYYILLENGKTVEDALKEMINYKTNANEIDENINVYNSAMKGYLDNWYKKNLTDYASYLDAASVYCFDRSISDLGGWNPRSLTGYLQFKQYNENKDLNCINETDRFAVTNNKAELNYPIGLLTEPERNLMTANFAKTGQNYWGASPSLFHVNYAFVHDVDTLGDFNETYAANNFGARGVVTLLPGTMLENGTGTYTDPYIVGPIVQRDN